MSTEGRAHGVMMIDGEEPKQLLLSNGSRLTLDVDTNHRAVWCHVEGNGVAAEVSVAEALALAGEPYAGYIAVRTRAEAAWLRNLAEWCGTEADRLDLQLAAR